MENQPRTLVVMRHARAVGTGPSDLERELAVSGLADAARAGEWLAEFGFTPDQALVSTARRTRETWEQARAAAGWALEADFDSSLYSAGPESALDVVRMLPATVQDVLLIGHNPTASQLAQLLSDGVGDPALLTAMTQGFPPAAMTVLEFHGGWRGLEFGTAKVTGFHVARG